MSKFLFVKRFLAAFSTLMIAAAVVVAMRAFLMTWLSTQSWYVGSDHATHVYVFDTETKKWIWEDFFPLWPYFAACVCAVDSLVAASMNIVGQRNRIIAASAGTILFLPFGILGFAPWTYIPVANYLFLFGFHATAVVLFFLALTWLLRIDRRSWNLWKRADGDAKMTQDA